MTTGNVPGPENPALASSIRAWRHLAQPQADWAPAGLPHWLAGRPGWLARGLAESRVAVEGLHHPLDLTELVAGVPDGGGRPILVIPGFGFGDTSSLPMQRVFTRAGYSIASSQIAFNMRCSDVTVHRLVKVAEQACEADGGRPLLVVGQSRGGMLARGLAVRRPDLVDKAIVLGSPLNDEFAFYELPRPLVWVLRATHYMADPELRAKSCSTAQCICQYTAATQRPIPDSFRLVSLYSRTDGVVDWRACVVPGATNVEVQGSHLGMGLRRSTLATILEHLEP